MQKGLIQKVLNKQQKLHNMQAILAIIYTTVLTIRGKSTQETAWFSRTSQ